MFQDATLIPALPGAWKVATGLPALSVTVMTTGLHCSNEGLCFSFAGFFEPFRWTSPRCCGCAADDAVWSPFLSLSSFLAHSFGTSIAFASEYMIAGPLGGFGVLNSPGAGP